MPWQCGIVAVGPAGPSEACPQRKTDRSLNLVSGSAAGHDLQSVAADLFEVSDQCSALTR
jgi:hypothetical protein